jgi:hypothetical protein
MPSKRMQEAASRIPLTPSQILTKRSEFIVMDIPIYSRTGQSTCSFSDTLQTYYLNLNNQLISTIFWTDTVLTSTGLALYEYVMVHHLSFKWLPSELQPVQGTFQPAAFNLRYLDAYSDDTNLPTSYQVSSMPVNLECLPQQTFRPQLFNIECSNKARFGEGDSGCLGQLQTVGTFNGQSGIIVINQPAATINTIASYNPQIGVLKITFQMYLINGFF